MTVIAQLAEVQPKPMPSKPRGNPLISYNGPKTTPSKPWDSKYKRLVHRIVKKINVELLGGQYTVFADRLATRTAGDEFPSVEQCDAAILQVHALMCFSPPISRSGRVKCPQDMFVYRGLVRAFNKLKMMRKLAEVAKDMQRTFFNVLCDSDDPFYISQGIRPK